MSEEQTEQKKEIPPPQTKDGFLDAEQIEYLATASEQSSDVIAKTLQDLVVVEGTLTFKDVPRVKYLVRPAPVPEGWIAVMLRSFKTGYFLVKLNADCKGCGGDGLDKRKNAPEHISEIPYCPACIHTEVQHFGRCWELKIAEREIAKEQDEIAERADKNLEARINKQKETVAKLEAERDAALGQNKLDVEATKAKIEALKGDAVRFDEEHAEYKRRLKERTKEFEAQTAGAKEVYEDVVRVANEALQKELARIKAERDAYVSEHSKALEALANAIGDNAREQGKAEDALKKYIAGPAKIAKRWEERIEPAKKTLARLEKQWKA